MHQNHRKPKWMPAHTCRARNRYSAAAMDIDSPVAVARLVGSIADVESAIEARETLKRWFSRWLRLHIVLAFALYLFLALHVWAGIHFGLRWF